MWPYVEYTLGLILSSQRGRDAKLFHNCPAFSELRHPSLEVTSPECGPSNSELSSHHGNEGGSQFPVLSWRPSESDVFAKADVKEYLLIVEDPDAPLPNPIVHGVYYAIPADTRSIDALSFDIAAEHDSNDLKGGFKFGQNRMGNVYGGPKPVLGHGAHRYFYQVVALSDKLDPDSFATKLPTIEELAKAVEGKVLALGVWVGVFERKMWTR